MILHTLIDYDTLRVIWWGLLGVLLIGFAVMGGFDLGVGAMLPFVAKTDLERRVVINSIGATWEGNQVWLILAGGAIFAAWPHLYAISFSGFYLAMFAVLFALILRPVGFKYRSKLESPRWRSGWDAALCVGGVVPALIFGVALGNVLLGVPYRLDDDLRIFYDGSFLGLLSPFALLCGVVSVAMLVMHGASWLQLKTEGVVAARARAVGMAAALLMVVLYALAGYVLWSFIDGYRITSDINPGGPSNPVQKTVELVAAGWFANYQQHPWTLLAPGLGLLGGLGVFVLLFLRMNGAAFVAGALAIAGVIGSIGASMFPIILPSSVQPNSSLAVWDASSSHLTLFIMLVVTVFFMPIIVAYTTWVYRVLWGKVSPSDISDESKHAY
jgi:cytochrome d ubiquinol oxidase subunit II